jgi:hypothetical protein
MRKTSSRRGKRLTPKEIDGLVALFKSAHPIELDSRARSLLAKYPGSGFVWNALGLSLQRQGKDALAVLQKASELLPRDSSVLSNLGTALKNMGRFEDALASFRRALAINPDFAEGHYNLGNTLQGTRQRLSRANFARGSRPVTSSTLQRARLRRLKHELNLYGLKGEHDTPLCRMTENACIQQGHYVPVYSLHITPDASGGLADRHGTRPAHCFEQLPSFGRKHLPQQLGRGKANASLTLSAAGFHGASCIRKRVRQGTNLKNDCVHDSTS